MAVVFCALLLRYAVSVRKPQLPRSDSIHSVDHTPDRRAWLPKNGDKGAEGYSPVQLPQQVDGPSPFVEDDEDIADDEEVERTGELGADASALDQPAGAPLSSPNTATSGGAQEALPTAAAVTTEDVAAAEEAADDETVVGGKGVQPRGDLLRALQQASQPEGVSDFIGGARSVQPSSSGAAGVAPRGTPEVGVSPTPVDARSWVEGQARGYTMLYAMQPQARAVVEAHIQTLEESRIREPYVGILIDGTFGEDFEYVKSIISRLSKEGRRLTLALYLSNGPTMRVHDSTPIDALFSRIEPESFRYRIIEEVELQNSYASVVERARALFEFNKQQNSANSNVAVVMLEDNLTTETYQFMRDIVRERLDGVDVSIVRNPCVGCYRGNDGDTRGDSREEHSVERFELLRQGDGFSLDGTGFDYPGGASSKGLSSSALLQLMRDSTQRGLRYVGMWRFPWQGLTPGGGKPHPSERIYVPSTETERSFEIEALREGLRVEGANE